MTTHETAEQWRPVGAEPVAHVAAQVDRLCWTGILLGLAVPSSV